jgi:phosphatidylglycerol:prolipoprotein diacylglycerol transferase
MYPVLFELPLGPLGTFTVGTYGLFYALGFLAALRLAVGQARREGIETARIIDLGIVVLVAGFLGAKVLLYAIDWRYYLQHPIEMVRSLRSAGVFYGGFLAAALAAVWYIRRHHLPLGRITDLAAPAMALGQAIGRIGCFAAGCCYGRACDRPWAVTFTDPDAFRLTGAPLGVAVHPTQIYHALADLLILGLTLFVLRRRSRPGQVFWVYVLAYALLRFVVEFYRGDTARGLFLDGRFSTSQILAMAAAAVAVIALFRLRRPATAPGRRRDA